MSRPGMISTRSNLFLKVAIVGWTGLCTEKFGNSQIVNTRSQQESRMFYFQLILGGSALKPEKCEQMGV